MKEIFKAIKKNFGDLVLFLFCVGLGVAIPTGAIITYFDMYVPQAIYLTDCTAMISTVENYQDKNSTAAYIYDRTPVYNYTHESGKYPTDLSCTFSPAEKIAGMDKIYNSNQKDFSSLTVEMNLLNNLENFRNKISSDHSAGTFNLETSKKELGNLIGQDKVKDAQTYKDLDLIGYKEYNNMYDTNSSHFAQLKTKITTSTFHQTLDKLESDNKDANLMQDARYGICVILIALLFGFILYFVSHFTYTLKRFLRYMVLGNILFCVLVAIIVAISYFIPNF